MWLQYHYFDGLQGLNPPATESELKKLENTLGFKLPEDFANCLRIHNGQNNQVLGLFAGDMFLSTDLILDEWKTWKELVDDADLDDFTSEPEQGIKNVWWNKKWVPFTYNGSGDHYCIDIDPDSSGIAGQIITMWHDSPERELLTKGFTEWFSNYVSDLLTRKYIYSDEYNLIISVEDK